ncbi:hypothetical protein Cgig2_012907 [Carnegiea gigantea]|uniref:Uncharacterized protein n=1 Tax=Carnegiea gigantea TaxID=171969 RepID=A0A9Q1K6C6_9CARY|nr:hypothetical protein Cgig2_012907 [Carnegiea gigantea]
MLYYGLINKKDNNIRLQRNSRAQHVWAPICEEELKSKEGLEFDNLDECERFYRTYTHLYASLLVRKINKGLKCISILFTQRKDLNALQLSQLCSKIKRNPEKRTLALKGIRQILKKYFEKIKILPPKQSNTKGRGKRIKVGKEQAIEGQQKTKRLCNACGEQV